MNLESTAASLLEQFPGGNVTDLARSERRLERFGQFAFGGFGIVLLIAIGGLVYTIFTRMVLSGQQPLAGLVLMAFLIFAAMALTYVAFAEDLKEKRKKRVGHPAAPPVLDAAVVTGRLLEEQEFVPAVSVTENTTDLLPTPNRRHKETVNYSSD